MEGAYVYIFWVGDTEISREGLKLATRTGYKKKNKVGPPDQV